MFILLFMAKKKLQIKSILATNIIRLRKEKGWTGEQLAKQIGVHVNAIRRIETDETEGSTETRKQIAEALGVRLELLYMPPHLKDVNAFLIFYDKFLHAPAHEQEMIYRLFQINDDDIFDTSLNRPIDRHGKSPKP